MAKSTSRPHGPAAPDAPDAPDAPAAPDAPDAPAAPDGPGAGVSELDDIFDELDVLLKNPDVGAELAAKGVNTSLAMTLAYGLRTYLHGDKEKALLEIETATDEIAARMARQRGGEPS